MNGSKETYKEWDVEVLDPAAKRGLVRLVTGSSGSAYYTDTHYSSFTAIRDPMGSLGTGRFPKVDQRLLISPLDLYEDTTMGGNGGTIGGDGAGGGGSDGDPD